MSDSPDEDDAIVLALTTVPDAEAGARIASALVGERVAACVSRVAEVVSLYRFEGAVHEDPESLLLIKTTAAKVPELERRIAELHPYKVPELLVFRAAAVSGPYASWLRSVTG